MPQHNEQSSHDAVRPSIPLALRAIRRRVGWPRLAWAAWLAALSVFLLVVVGSNLGNYPPVSGDDAWIMSASHKWASEGVFGSDLYTGFANADQHYFIALPVYHALQASVFVVFGTGIAEARAVSLASALVLLWAVAWLTLRRLGPAESALTSALLVFWRWDIVAFPPGIPLADMARTGRYDVTALAFMWLAVVLLDRLQRRASLATALGVGVCAGLATLTQFFGAFVVPLVALAWCWLRGRAVLADRATYAMLAGFALVTLPYAVYVAAYWPDFVAQADLKAGRISFDDPGFYWRNIVHAPRRIARLTDRSLPILWDGYNEGNPVSVWLALLGTPPALGYLLWRARRTRAWIDGLIAASALVFAGLLVLLDGTQASLYLVVVWPPLCIACASACVALARRAHQWRPRLFAVLLNGALVALLAVIVWEGAAAYRTYRDRAAVTDYAVAAERIAAEAGADGTTLGPNRWWWGMHVRHYLALEVIRRQWQMSREKVATASVATLMARADVSHVVIDDHARADIGHFPAAFQQQFWAYVEKCTTRVTTWTDPTYGPIEVRALAPPVACR